MDAPISVAALLDEHIAALEEPREPDGMYHPSSYWGCDRKVIYELRGVERSNPPGPKSKRIFRIGHLLHEFVQGSIATAPEVLGFYPEFSIKTKLEETGHGDGLILLTDGTAIVLEIKSINSRGFVFLKDGPKDENAKQASSYAVAARKHGVWIEDATDPEGPQFVQPLGDRLIGVLVVYLEKESLEIREFFLPYDEAWEERVENRIAELNQYRDDPESLPPRQASKSKYPCQWRGGSAKGGGECDFYDRCWNGTDTGAGVKPVEPTEVPGAFEW